MKKPLLLYAILLLALVLRIPGWFTEDSKIRFKVFEPKELQQVEIARSLMRSWGMEDHDNRPPETTLQSPRAFGLQIGAIAFTGHFLTGRQPTDGDLVLLGRVLSTLYALLLIGLVYLLGLHLFHSRLAALFGALLMAVFDLSVTSGYYAMPTTAYAFWTCTAVFLLIMFYERFIGRNPKGEPGWALALAIPLAAAQAFAVHFDFLPIVLAAAVLLLLLTRKKIDLRNAVGYAGSFFAFFVLFFYLTTFFDFGWAEVRGSFSALYQENRNAVLVDHHWISNPVLYLSAIVSGTSALVMIVFTIALISLFGRGKTFPGHVALRWWLLFLVLELFVLWMMDTAYVRRAHIFLPFIAALTGRGLAGILRGEPDRPAWQRFGATWLVITYTFILTVGSQLNTWNDTRYEARDFLLENANGASVHYSPHAHIAGMPVEAPPEKAGFMVIHETYYGRYWKSFRTPFLYPPRCCDEVYHCFSTEECSFYQNLLSGSLEDFDQIAFLPAREWMPERRLFKYLFGSYDPFFGDMRIFKRN